jgi:hypothetical protein
MENRITFLTEVDITISPRFLRRLGETTERILFRKDFFSSLFSRVERFLGGLAKSGGEFEKSCVGVSSRGSVVGVLVAAAYQFGTDF